LSRVLFICTGNYYRSRFAEAVFNHHAALQAKHWSAFSRGLAIHMAEGDLSPLIHAALQDRQIPLERTGATRVTLSAPDLEEASIRIALDDAEHRPMVRDRFPHWEDRVRFWEAPDAHIAAPEEVLPLIERLVLELLDSLN